MKKLKRLLSEFIGVEESDINDDDSLTQDLHMSPSDLTDFIEKLALVGYETEGLDLTETETVSDLLENLGQNI